MLAFGNLAVTSARSQVFNFDDNFSSTITAA
jgi:hypothetical protein